MTFLANLPLLAQSATNDRVGYEFARLQGFDDKRLAVALIVLAIIALVSLVVYLYRRDTAELPRGIGMEWTGVSYQERAAGAQTPLLYTLSLLVVFLCLAALYESWAIPTAALMVVPLGILGTVLASMLRGMERDVYFQVAMLTTVGLSSKNAILIVEFAKANVESGMDLIKATIAAVRDRLRPILMTSLAFGFGVLPLAVATGAGSGAQQAIGTGVIGGMVLGTFLGIFFIPLFFVVVRRVLVRRSRPPMEPRMSADER